MCSKNSQCSRPFRGTAELPEPPTIASLQLAGMGGYPDLGDWFDPLPEDPVVPPTD